MTFVGPFLIAMIQIPVPLRAIRRGDDGPFDRIAWKMWLAGGLAAVVASGFSRSFRDGADAAAYAVAMGMGAVWTMVFMVVLAVVNQGDADGTSGGEHASRHELPYQDM